MNVAEAVRDSYGRQWGHPSREAAFSTQGDQVEISTWDASDATEGVTIYATNGCSTSDMPGAIRGHRVEYVVVMLPSRDEIAPALAGLAIYARQMDVEVGHGHTVPAEGPLWPGSPMSTFLVLEPSTPVVPPLLLSGGIHVEFLQAIPVFESERRFKNENGAEALLERWESNQVPFWDPRRAADPAR